MAENEVKYIQPMTTLSNNQLSISSSPTDGASNRQLYNLFDGAYNTSVIFTEPSYWVLLDFVNPVAFDKCEFGGLNIVAESLPKHVIIQASNDNVDWINLKEEKELSWTAPSTTTPQINTLKWENKKSYKYYKFYCVSNGGRSNYLFELNFFQSGNINKVLIQLGNDGVIQENTISNNLIPVMTSHNNPEGYVSATSEATNNQFKAWNAFNGDASNAWQTESGIKVAKLNYEFKTSKCVNEYSLTPRASASSITACPTTWTFEGSNDGVNYKVLHEVIGEVWLDYQETKSYAFKNEENYKHYRLNITANGGHSLISLGELGMFYRKRTVKHISDIDISEQNIINHGMDTDTEIDLSAEMTNKIFIEQTPTTLGEGKVFSRKIDTSKTPIKKVTIE